ncbi:MAG: O-antigen ligase family protein [Candidatus Loosdrechtia sp.]|uniref:O-antigen ligase family protein n=1 Tax=Candidatus Loosdrechtia sp. TaxID=3101272 RepID=UPI003A61145B|nr:MAG: O-antigen ligase family protein [Candidatus Jettenia sp. AMX2]
MGIFVQTESLEGNTIDKILFYCLCGLFFFIALGVTSITVTASIIAISIWLFSGKFFKQKDRWLKQKWTPPVIFFMLLPCLALLWTNDMELGLKFAKKSYYWILSFVIASIALSSQNKKILFDFFLAGLALFCIASILKYINIFFIPKWIPTTDFGKHITQTLFLVFGITLLSYYFKVYKKNLFYVLLTLLFLFTLSIAYGRSGYLTFILLSPIIAYNFFGKRFFLTLAIIIAFSTLFFSVSPAIKSRIVTAVDDIRTYQTGDPNTSVGLRLIMWQGAIKIFLKNPLIGVGTGGYTNEQLKYNPPNILPEYERSRHPHNSFLFMAANYGMLGVVSIIWLFIAYFKKSVLSWNTLTGFAILSYGLIIFIGSMTETQILSPGTAKMFALLMGIKTENESS